MINIKHSQLSDFIPERSLSESVATGENRLEHLEHIVQSSDSIVHDMNNQLTAIMSMSDLLIRHSQNTPSVSDGLQRILDSARELSVLAARWQELLNKDGNPQQGDEFTDGVSPSLKNGQAANGQAAKDKNGMKRPSHVLLIDDEEVVCAATEQMLMRLNYKVTTRCSGMAGVEFYRENHAQIGLVVLDMMMPEMDGMQVFSELKKIDPDVNVLVSSGYSHNDAATALLKSGARGYIQKPFRIKELSKVVTSILPAAETPPTPS